MSEVYQSEHAFSQEQLDAFRDQDMRFKPQAAQRTHGVANETLKRMGEQLDQEYRAERAQAAERLHNGLVEVIGEQQPSVETLLYVIEMIKHDLLEQQHGKVFIEPARNANPSPVRTSSIGIA